MKTGLLLQAAMSWPARHSKTDEQPIAVSGATFLESAKFTRPPRLCLITSQPVRSSLRNAQDLRRHQERQLRVKKCSLHVVPSPIPTVQPSLHHQLFLPTVPLIPQVLHPVSFDLKLLHSQPTFPFLRANLLPRLPPKQRLPIQLVSKHPIQQKAFLVLSRWQNLSMIPIKRLQQHRISMPNNNQRIHFVHRPPLPESPSWLRQLNRHCLRSLLPVRIAQAGTIIPRSQAAHRSHAFPQR